MLSQSGCLKFTEACPFTAAKVPTLACHLGSGGMNPTVSRTFA